jgi:type IV secretory pathway VirB3-like protein
MSDTDEKNLPLAIGLNLLLPGVGYMYMGRPILGIGVLLLIVGMALVNALLAIPVWLVMNVIMAIDMFILASKRKADTMTRCSQCAESIQKQARVCRYCGAAQVAPVAASAAAAPQPVAHAGPATVADVAVADGSKRMGKAVVWKLGFGIVLVAVLVATAIEALHRREATQHSYGAVVPTATAMAATVAKEPTAEALRPVGDTAIPPGFHEVVDSDGTVHWAVDEEVRTRRIRAAEQSEPNEGIRSLGNDPPFPPPPEAAAPVRSQPVVARVYMAEGLYYREDCEHPARAVLTPKAMAIQQGARPAASCYGQPQRERGRPRP